MPAPTRSKKSGPRPRAGRSPRCARHSIAISPRAAEPRKPARGNSRPRKNGGAYSPPTGGGPPTPKNPPQKKTTPKKGGRPLPPPALLPHWVERSLAEIAKPDVL